MTMALTFLLGAFVIATLMPRPLRRLASNGVPPVVALTGWLGSMAAVVFFVLSAAAIMMWPNHAPAEGITEVAVRCFTTFQHALQPWVGESLAGAGIALLSVGALRMTGVARRQRRSHSRVLNYHRDVVAVIARTEPASADVYWLDHPTPIAYSVDGRPGFVVATKGLKQCLTDTQRDAVLAHERAHLRGRHHSLVNVCELFARVFPRVPLFVAAPGSVRALVEFAADERAARATSADAMRTALTAVCPSVVPHPAGTLALAADDVAIRLRRLEDQPRLQCIRSACIIVVVFPVVAAAGTALLTMITFSMTAHLLFA